MRKTITPLICAVSAAIAAAPATALAHAAPQTVSRTAVSAQDTAWVQAAIQANLAEVQAGQIAESKTSNKFVAGLGKSMVSIHTTLLKDAEGVATKLNIAIPTTPSASQQAELTAIQALTGRAFNTTFVSDEAAGFQQFIQLTEQELSTGVNTRVRASARLFLPDLKHRLSQSIKAAGALHMTLS